MMSANRQHVKTPVANKTKRGAELEGTLKTPRSYEQSPGNSISINGEHDDGRLHLRSRRHLQWSNMTKQGGSGGMNEDSCENKPFPIQHEHSNNYTGDSKTVAALSPICVNVLPGNFDDQRGHKTRLQKPGPSAFSLKAEDSSKINDHEWSVQSSKREQDDTGLMDESCPSSVDCKGSSPLSGDRVLLWSNAAFSQGVLFGETTKDTASSSSCSSSISSSESKADLSVCEADSKSTHSDIEFAPKMNDHGSNDNGRLKRSAIISKVIPDPEPESIIDVGCQHARQEIKQKNPKNDGLCLARNRKALLVRNIEVLDANMQGSINLWCGEPRKQIEVEKSVELGEKGMSLDKIKQEIQSLTKRLTELHIQKRKREEEMKMPDKEMGNREEIATRKEESDNWKCMPEEGMKAQDEERHNKKEVMRRKGEAANKLHQQKGTRAGAAGAGRGNDVKCRSSAVLLQSPSAQLRKSSKFREGSPLASMTSRVPASVGSMNKLSEVRRSVSSVSRRPESRNRCTGGAEASKGAHAKVFRRLSLSGATVAVLGGQHEQSQPQPPLSKSPSISSKGTPSRVVSSRYGRATTPDVCIRPTMSGGSSHPVTSCKKRDRPFSASSSPLPQSIPRSPLKKVATLRNGYPSQSGFTTPTKEHQQFKPAISSNTPTRASCSSLKACDCNLFHSPSKSSVPRFDSPKSTAALYKCLESLLEEGKHFFKHLSPARTDAQRRLHTMSPTIPAMSSSPMACLATSDTPKPALELVLPTINTNRLAFISPRDSGCVKRAADRQKKQFFFAKEDFSSSPTILTEPPDVIARHGL